MWVEDLKSMYYFRDVYIDVIFNIKQVEMGCVTSVLTQHKPFIKCVNRVRSCQPTSLTIRIKIEELTRLLNGSGLG